MDSAKTGFQSRGSIPRYWWRGLEIGSLYLTLLIAQRRAPATIQRPTSVMKMKLSPCLAQTQAHLLLATHSRHPRRVRSRSQRPRSERPRSQRPRCVRPPGLALGVLSTCALAHGALSACTLALRLGVTVLGACTVAPGVLGVLGARKQGKVTS